MILKVSNVSKEFKQGKTIIPALKNVSFNMYKNESLSITGPSGSGKTTLLSLLGGLDSPTSGNIIINDSIINQMNEKELAQFRSKHIGIIFQQYHLMPHLTALENVCLPLEISKEDNVERKAKDILEMVGLKNRITHMPHQLSGGECQRVAIARAMVIKPEILLADEPSGNLDTETGHHVMNLLFSLTQNVNMTLILVTHDLELAKRCQNQIHMMGGILQ